MSSYRNRKRDQKLDAAKRFRCATFGKKVTGHPGLVMDMAQRAAKMSGDEFLKAEAKGERQRKNAHTNVDERRDARWKSRITLPKVKGYWE